MNRITYIDSRELPQSIGGKPSPFLFTFFIAYAGSILLPFILNRQKVKYLAVLILMLLPRLVIAGIPNMPFRFELLASKDSYRQRETIQFRLRITNTDKGNILPVLMPCKKYCGNKLIYLKVFSLVNGVQKELGIEYKYDSDPAYGDGETITYLKPGAHVDIPIYLYTKPHISEKTAERHYLNAVHDTGMYIFMACYDPYQHDHPDLYHYVNESGWPPSKTGKITFYIDGIWSLPCTVDIRPNTVTERRIQKMTCTDKCRFCKKIEKGRWGAVRRYIHHRTKQTAKGINISATSHGYWLAGHRNVMYVSPSPDEILSIFPGRMERLVDFKSRDPIHRFSIVFQMGKIYKFRSHLQGLLYGLGVNGNVIRTTREDYAGVQSFKPVTETKDK